MSKLKGRIAPFNPGNMDPELLQELLVGKDQILKTLVGNIISSAKEKSAPPQQLIVAPRGYGKTHLINVVHSNLKKSRGFNKNLLVAFFKEEEHVSGYLDFLRRVLQALIKDCPNPELEDAFEQIFADPSSEMVAQTESFLNQYIGHRLLVILCENLGEIFEGLEEEGQRKLRAFLHNSGKISLFCTTQKLFEPLMARNFPFYGFFSRTELEPFSDKEAWKLLKRLADNADDLELSEYLDSKMGKARVAAVCELTNGNPRLIALLSGFLDKGKLEGLTEAFMEMIETSLTPYYQEQMARLSHLQKRIIEILCEKGDGNPLSVKMIAEKALTTSQSISHQLKKMQELGVLFSAKKGRETFYGMAEPLWRVSIEVKNNQEGILPVVVEFIKITKSFDEIYLGLSELKTRQSTVYSHFVRALRDSCQLFESKERNEVFAKRIKEIANFLPSDIKKAESLAQTLTAVFDDERVSALLSALQVLNGNAEVEELVKFRNNAYPAFLVLADQGFLRHSMSSPKEKGNFLLLLKYVLLGEMGDYRPSLLEEINSSYVYYLIYVPCMLSFSGKDEMAIRWLLRVAKDPKNYSSMREALFKWRDFGGDKISKNLWEKIFLPTLEKIDSSFFEEDTAFCFLLFIVFVENEYKIDVLKLLTIFGDKMSAPFKKSKIFWLICSSLVCKGSKVLEFWLDNKIDILKVLGSWRDSEVFKNVLYACEAFANGDDEGLAPLSLEFRENMEKSRNRSYSELISFLRIKPEN